MSVEASVDGAVIRIGVKELRDSEVGWIDVTAFGDGAVGRIGVIVHHGPRLRVVLFRAGL